MWSSLRIELLAVVLACTAACTTRTTTVTTVVLGNVTDAATDAPLAGVILHHHDQAVRRGALLDQDIRPWLAFLME